MKTKSNIPINYQGSEAIGGIYIVHLSMTDINHIEIDNMGVHRDNYYAFFVLTKGSIKMECDTVEIEFDAVSIGFVRPFQVHSIKQISDDTEGYFISIAPFLIPNVCSDLFQNLEIKEQNRKIDKALIEDLQSNISLLHNTFNKKQPNKAQIINGLFNALIYNFANLFQSNIPPINLPKNQSRLISANFKKLINQNNFSENPAFFAKKLNISTSHLNDCVNSITGKSVTYWLQNAMILEAQRQLYYTENDVKEIAYHLGFEDHSYFSRLFKKLTNETPLTFRKKFRE
ncbi:helix-turn-helix domain-containing protein [Flavobacterium aquicola]|uniref:AraC family transcriptional regulator n=1 Tax=Flavobacterium aquicola TaxID=1682742 RepID=A0A3E0ES71_9FLAO|nr:helix-turn-helix domain-containing protein [Flavobacterium aquicola]REH00976.1 AraC family transcriptional regulator [Flavobacterium aquicola]